MGWRTAGSVIGSWTEVVSDDPDRDLEQALALDGSWIWNMAERTVLVRTDQLEQLAGGVTVVDDPPRPMPNQLDPVPLAVPGPRYGEPWAKVAASLVGVDPNADPGDLVYDAGADKWNYYDHTGTWQPLGGGGAGAVSPLTLTSHNTTEIPLTLVGATSQTGNLLVVKDGGGTTRMSMSASGILTLGSSTLSGIGTDFNFQLGSGGNAYFQSASLYSFDNAIVGNTSLGLGGDQPPYGGGAGPMIFLGDATSAPTTNPSWGGILYSTGGTLRYRSKTGAVTSLGQTISANQTELVLEQTGSGNGTTRLHITNNNGMNGALFENAALPVVDFGFQPASTYQSNFRLEGRSPFQFDPANGSGSNGEFQFFINMPNTPVCGSWTGQNGGGQRGRFAIGPSATAQTLFGGGAGPMIFLGNDTSDPSTNPVGGGIIYCSGGALKYRGTSGTVTTLAPA